MTFASPSSTGPSSTLGSRPSCCARAGRRLGSRIGRCSGGPGRSRTSVSSSRATPPASTPGCAWAVARRSLRRTARCSVRPARPRRFSSSTSTSPRSPRGERPSPSSPTAAYPHPLLQRHTFRTVLKVCLCKGWRETARNSGGMGRPSRPVGTVTRLSLIHISPDAVDELHPGEHPAAVAQQ